MYLIINKNIENAYNAYKGHKSSYKYAATAATFPRQTISPTAEVATRSLNGIGKVADKSVITRFKNMAATDLVTSMPLQGQRLVPG